MLFSSRAALVSLVSAALLPTVLGAQQWGIAARHHLNWGGPRSRAGDIQGYGLSLTRTFGKTPDNRSSVSVSLDHFEYDLETPIHATTVEPRAGDLAVDAFTTVTRGQLDLVRRLRVGSRWTPFGFAGLGLYHIDIPEISGNTADGGTFTLRTDSPVTTAGATIGVGSEWRVVGGVSFSLALAYSQTVAKYRVTERRSGETGEIAPFAPLGLGTQLVYRW